MTQVNMNSLAKSSQTTHPGYRLLTSLTTQTQGQSAFYRASPRPLPTLVSQRSVTLSIGRKGQTLVIKLTNLTSESKPRPNLALAPRQHQQAPRRSTIPGQALVLPTITVQRTTGRTLAPGLLAPNMISTTPLTQWASARQSPMPPEALLCKHLKYH